MVFERTLVVVMTATEAISVVIRILRRTFVLLDDLPPYHAARKQQPMTPAFARSLSRKKATTPSNSQERPAALFTSSRSWSLSSPSRLPSDDSINEKKTATANSRPPGLSSSPQANKG